jgi:hypothetical protein
MLETAYVHVGGDCYWFCGLWHSRPLPAALGFSSFGTGNCLNRLRWFAPVSISNCANPTRLAESRVRKLAHEQLVMLVDFDPLVDCQTAIGRTRQTADVGATYAQEPLVACSINLSLLHRLAAVDDHGMSGHECRPLRAQPQYRRSDFFRFAHPACRFLGNDLGSPFRGTAREASIIGVSM